MLIAPKTFLCHLPVDQKGGGMLSLDPRLDQRLDHLTPLANSDFDELITEILLPDLSALVLFILSSPQSRWPSPFVLA